MKNLVIGVIAFTILFMGLGWLLVGQPEDTSPAEVVISVNDQVYGSASASAILVEYSDFQCPACAAYYEMVNQLKADMGNSVQIVYRHFPLRQIHPNAQLAAQAAEAAGIQGVFWQMHDKLFETQIEWSSLDDPTEYFTSIATDLEIDVEDFISDVSSEEVIEKVNVDYQSGLQYSVNSTPTFLLNGKKLNNPGSYEVFKSLVESALE